MIVYAHFTLVAIVIFCDRQFKSERGSDGLRARLLKHYFEFGTKCTKQKYNSDQVLKLLI